MHGIMSERIENIMFVQFIITYHLCMQATMVTYKREKGKSGEDFRVCYHHLA